MSAIARISRGCGNLVALSLAMLFASLSPIAAQAQPPRRSRTPQATTHAETKPSSRDQYIGDQACRSCHEAEFNSYQATAHHLTSRVANEHSIAGTFNAGSNLFKTANPSLTFKMTADDKGFYQTAVDQVTPTKSVELSERFDLVVGSGRKAQTYLFWKDDDLFELPVSWWVKSGIWINSPGYQDGSIRFDRPIVPRCLECHGSYFQSLAPPSNRYNRASLVLGIECEKCHGPGREHVALYTAQKSGAVSKAEMPKAILNPASLSRNRQIDACSLCHAGLGKPLAPALSFRPGDALEKYLQIPEMEPDLAVDVHGNQVQLLQQSRCFRSSSMTCSTCHNVHQVQRDAAAFSSVCLNCHKAQQCGKFKTLGAEVTRNCIDCHMPLQKSQTLFSESNDQTLQLPVRSHRIAIYADGQPNSPHERR